MSRIPMLCIAAVLWGCDRPTTGAPVPPSARAAPLPPAEGTSPVASATSDAGAPAHSAEEALGGPPRAFEPVVGDWTIAERGGTQGLYVDGSKWRSGEPSASLADQAKRLYGDGYATFLDGVKAFAFFPFAIHRDPPPAGDMRVSVRFYPEGGRIDQAAGILWGISEDGSYWGARANALEDNILYFHVVRGRRTVLDTVRNTPTASKTWHVLEVDLASTRIAVTLDGIKRFEKRIDRLPPGRVGLWAKADSQVLFADFKVAPLGGITGDEKR
jgi:hypothetical protein